MNETLIYTVITLSAIGIVAAVVLYYVAQKFKVFEDPRIADVEKMLPGANCGGCGYPGCKGLADALVKSEKLDSLHCPVGGGDVMAGIAKYLGKEAAAQEPMVAVVKCRGASDRREKTSNWEGAMSCAIMSSLYPGQTACSYGCLGCGDCSRVCNFGAIKIDPDREIVIVDEEKCTGCGMCAVVCPKKIIEVMKKGPKNRRLYVECSSKDKGGVARKACSAACIGCGKCVKACPFDAITVENNLAKIDPSKCKMCRKCVAECPTGAILEVNFPPRKPKVETEAKTATATPKVETATPKAETTAVQAETTAPKAE